MAIPGEDLPMNRYNAKSRQYLDRAGLIEYTSKIKSTIEGDVISKVDEKVTAEAQARAAGDSALQQSINNLPTKAYSKITAVSGSATTAIEASGKDNELKLKAGSNVTLSADTSNKVITINANDTTYSAATKDAPGLMSAKDKAKLDGIAEKANNYSLTPATSTSLGGVKVPADSGITLSPDGNITLTKDKLVQLIGAFSGASSTAAGTSGLVPQPLKGGNNLYLKGDGTWGTPANTNTTYTLGSGTNNGTLKLTPSSGAVQDNIAVTGLKSLAYKDSLSASDVGAVSKDADYIVGATVNGNTLTLQPNGKAGIRFTNSVYDTFKGATTSTVGQVGLVPAPAKGATSLYLKSNGTWGTPDNTVYTHPNSGVTAGTYRSVTVNAQGHVTAGSSPSTLAGYGITDAKIVGGTITLGTSSLTPITTATATNPTATFGSTVSIGKVGDAEFKFTMPSKVSSSIIDGVLKVAQIPSLSLNKINSGTISLTGGAVGSQNLKETDSVSIDVTEVKEGYLTWGGKNFVGSVGPIDAVMIPILGANRLEACKAAGITVEYSRDGGATWTDYGLSDVEKRRLLSSYGSDIKIGKAGTTSDQYKANYQVRVTLDTSKCGVQTVLHKFAIYISTGSMPGTYCTIEAAPNASPTAWEVITNKQSIAGWAGWNIININPLRISDGSSYYGWIRFTFGGTDINTAHPDQGLRIYNILGFGGVGWTTPSTIAKYGVPYINYAINATSEPMTEFQGPVMATSFSGALNGNATTATALISKSIGGTTKPVYFDANGRPVAINYTIESSVPANAKFTDTNTHYTTGLVTSNSATGTSNVAATNGNVYLNLKDDSTIRNSHKIVGTGATTVTSDANGTITIASTNTNTWRSIKVGSTTLSDTTTPLTIKGGGAASVSLASGTLTINAQADDVAWKTSKADASALTAHTGNTTVHITAEERTKWNNAAAGDLRALANKWQQKQEFSASGTVEAGSTSGSGAINVTSGGIWAAGGIKGNKVYNAVWNDLADCIPVDDEVELEAGRCYCFNGTNYYKSNKYLADGIIGIHSDTYGMHMGSKQGVKQMDVAVAGFVLAYVDQEYPVGTPLTCGPDGMLVKIERDDKIEYPEKIIATYWKREPSEYWGSDTQKVKVNGRKWVKIK